jgi:hypothetical protein
MPYKKNAGAAGAAANITSQTLSSTIDTTNPLLPKLKLKSVIDQSGTVISSNDLLIDLEEIQTSGTTSVSATDSSTIDFSGNGTVATPLTAVSKVSATAGNALTANPDGLFVPTVSGGGISTDLGQRLILGSDSKAFEDKSGHLVAVYTSPDKISFSLNSKTAKPTASASAGTHQPTDPITSYNGDFVGFTFKTESAPIILPILDAGYSYLARITTHALIDNKAQQPYDFRVTFTPFLDNGQILSMTDSQIGHIVPAIQAQYAPNYTTDPTVPLLSYAQKNMPAALDVTDHCNILLPTNTTKFMCEIIFTLPCMYNQLFKQFIDPIDLSEFKYEIVFYMIKSNIVDSTKALTTPILQL